MSSSGHIVLLSSGTSGAPEWTLLAAGDFCAQERFSDAEDPHAAAARTFDGRLRGVVAAADLAIVNLEGPVRSAAAPLQKSGPPVALDPASPAVLRALGFAAASLANNHIMDYGAEGLERTLESCRAAGLATCGAGMNHADAMAPLVRELPGGVRLAIFSFCEREFGAAERSGPGSAWIGHPDAVVAVAAAAARGDLVVVAAHGGVEEIPVPPMQRQAQLHAFIDAGATLVIGHHPHVPQGWERYGDGFILHSLGNFLFDYPAGLRYPKTEWGVMARMRFSGRELLSVELLPVEMRADRTISIMADERRLRDTLEYLHAISELLLDRERFHAYWQEMALHLWQTRYRRWLQRSSGVAGGAGNIRAHLNGLLRGVKRRIGLDAAAAKAGLPDLGDPLMLLNLIRNESHRWSIETALAILHGDERDLRTPDIREHARELLTWTEG